MSINNFYHQIPSEQQEQQPQLWWQQMDPTPTTIPNASSSSSNSSSPSSSKLQSHPSNWPTPAPHHHNIPNWLSAAHNQIQNHNHNLNFNLNHDDDDDELEAERVVEVDKEGMFEKPLTPSDVGKLNRLVIPKQHAERYFPLAGEAVEKGLLLSFEDESGKCWRFRYSYWNSSQSYVLTKGWSRYVKEKQLDAGDVVLFQRHRSDAHRLFIAWRRRGSSANNSDHYSQQLYNQAVGSGGGGWGRGVVGGLKAAQPYLEDGGGGGGGMRSNNVGYQQPECVDAPGEDEPSGGKMLRLFGVNMEWQPEYQCSSVAEPTSSAALHLLDHDN
ncbi:unnamed protein product [Linum trigynum]|uniref:TF-B3 domain-containing protein n=1 Tax=Linum trigynum TaxID=586398 RepID=A0AAV2FBJ8_9ROSI